MVSHKVFFIVKINEKHDKEYLMKILSSSFIE